jgi:hypothetical protein
VLRWQGLKEWNLLQEKPTNGGGSYEKSSKEGSARWGPSKIELAGPYVPVEKHRQRNSTGLHIPELRTVYFFISLHVIARSCTT